MVAQAYSGSCHCGAVQYEATVDLDQTVSCNCSRCGRLGSILAFTPEDDFRLKSGGNELTEYLFNRNAIHHLFCKVCGIQSFARATTPDGRKTVAINTRTLEGVDPDALDPKKVDGKNF